MIKLQIFLVVAILGFFLVNAPAHAVSCTQQGATCAAWATGQYASYKDKCKQEISACIARCKQGSKFYLGVLVGNQYPIDACK